MFSVKSFSQSKKEQISTLQLRIDSLFAVLEQTRLQLNDSQNQLKDKISSSTETETRLNSELSEKSKALQAFTEKNAKINSQLTLLNDSLAIVINRANSLSNQNFSLTNERDLLKANVYDQSQLAILSNQVKNFCADWIKDTELELDVRLSDIIYGDMSTYLTFKTNNNTEISFSYWTWKCLNPNIDFFSDSDIGSYYRIKVKNTFVKELEYKGFDIGNVETGNLIREWVLLQITRKSN